MTAPAATGKPRPEVGRSRTRKEDARLVTGRTTWTDNITVPGLLHLAILRSPVAHARIDRVDVSPALKRPGWSPPSPDATWPTSWAPCPACGR